MTRKWFFLLTILAIAAITVLVIGPVTDAQRPDRTERRTRPEGMRGGMRGGGMEATSFVDNSWVDLTFGIKVDDEVLIKSRKIYQKHRDALSKAIEEARANNDFQAMRSTMTGVRDKLNTDLKTLLTEEQFAELDKLSQQRMQRMMRNRGGGRRGGGGGGRPGGGNR